MRRMTTSQTTSKQVRKRRQPVDGVHEYGSRRVTGRQRYRRVSHVGPTTQAQRVWRDARWHGQCVWRQCRELTAAIQLTQWLRQLHANTTVSLKHFSPTLDQWNLSNFVLHKKAASKFVNLKTGSQFTRVTSNSITVWVFTRRFVL